MCMLMYVAEADLILEGRTTGGERLPLSRPEIQYTEKVSEALNLRMQRQSLYKTLGLFLFANE